MSAVWCGIEVTSTGLLSAQPWGKLHVDINGHADVTPFGTKFYQTAAGRYTVEIGYTDAPIGNRNPKTFYLTRLKPAGTAKVVVDVAPGQVVHLEYKVPLLHTSRGKITVT